MMSLRTINYAVEPVSKVTTNSVFSTHAIVPHKREYRYTEA